MNSFHFLAFFFVLLYTFAEDKISGPKFKKDPRDFTENDVNNLFEQWEVMRIFIRT
jgi:hypothetical protein